MSWAYHWFKAEKRKISFTYDNCPFECRNDEKQWDEFRREYCEECPHRKADERLLSNATAIFKERFGQELIPEQFKKMLETVQTVAAFEGTDENLGVKHSHLLTAYLKEKDKMERQERANKPKA